jgi:hypothetical protein
VVEHLLSKHEAEFNTSTAERGRKEERKKGGREERREGERKERKKKRKERRNKAGHKRIHVVPFLWHKTVEKIDLICKISGYLTTKRID